MIRIITEKDTIRNFKKRISFGKKVVQLKKINTLSLFSNKVYH